MSEQRKVYVPIVSEAVSLVKWAWSTLLTIVVFLILLGVAITVSNKIFGWPEVIYHVDKPAAAESFLETSEREGNESAEKETRYRLLVALLSLDKAAGDAVGARMHSLPAEDRISTAEMRQAWEIVRAGRTPYQMIEAATPPNHMSKGALLDVFMALE